MSPPPRFLLCFLLFTSNLTGAEGLKTLPDSAEAMGKVGARFATLSDPSVVRTNPASMVDLEGTNFSFNFQLWHGETDFTQSGSGATDSMIDPWKPTGSFYLSHQLNDCLTVGLGISAPFGVAISWPSDGLFRYTEAYEATLQTVAINPAIGYQFSDKVSLGLGLDIFRSDLRLKQVYPWFLATGGMPVPDGNMEYNADGWGLGAYGSINIELTESQRLSVIGRLPVTVKYDGTFDVSNVPAGLPFQSRSSFASELEFPASIQVGYGIDLNERTTLGFDFDWTMNSSHDALPLDIGVNQPMLQGNDNKQLKWKDAFSIGTGISSQVTDCLTLRAGYLYSESPMSDHYYTPSIPANDRHIFSAGFGYDIDAQNRIDVAYSYIHLEDRAVNSNINPALIGDYDYSWHILTLGFVKKF